MIVKKDSWHYKIYDFSYGNYIISNKTNLCQYVNRICFVGIPKAIGIFVGLLFLVPFMVIISTIVHFIKFLFGYRPDMKHWHDWVEIQKESIKYKSLNIKGFSIYPYHILIMGFIIWLQYLAYYHFKLILIIEGFILGMLGLIVAIWWFLTSEKTNLLRQYIAAKKQGICPIVEFKDDRE